MAIQELTQNIVKHAQATEISLQIIRAADELTVMVEDNGVGFDPAQARGASGAGGIGLVNVEIRLAQLGGQAHFDAALGRGTIVTLTVPLPSEAAPTGYRKRAWQARAGGVMHTLGRGSPAPINTCQHGLRERRPGAHLCGHSPPPLRRYDFAPRLPVS